MDAKQPCLGKWASRLEEWCSRVLEYVRDLERAFAIPILRVSEYPGLSADDLRDELGQFHPPQGYVRLAHHPEMLAVCEKAAAEESIRRMTVHHR